MNWYGLFAVFIPVYAFLIAPIVSLAFPDTKNFLARTSETQWGSSDLRLLHLTCPGAAHARHPGVSGSRRAADGLPAFGRSVERRPAIRLGKLCGRHRIAPEISPSKTVEGFVGGAASAIALGGVLWRITPFNPWQATAMAVTITVMGFLGGLVMSAVKRDVGVKDWGCLIEGHGGMLDRLDSVVFAAPIFFHLTRYFFTP